MAKRQSISERFWSKVEVRGPDECWPWKAGKAGGYGHFRIDRTARGAHRVAWELVIGPVPEGLCVLHRCDNPPCVNVLHLFLGTRLENNADRVAKGRNGGASGQRNGAFTHPERVNRGERNGLSKLTDASVLAIRQAAAEGVSQRTIAKQHGVTHTLVGYVVRRKIWKHV